MTFQHHKILPIQILISRTSDKVQQQLVFSVVKHHIKIALLLKTC